MTVTAARGALVDVLAQVLPGRVFPYPPTQPSPVAPAVYVGEFSADWDTDVNYLVTFAVRLVADGAHPAAHALLDDLADQARAAVAGSSACYPGSIRWDPLDVDADHQLAAYTFDVQLDLATVTWCRPDPPVAVTVPPEPIGAPLP